jgi:hypothetical protein
MAYYVYTDYLNDVNHQGQQYMKLTASLYLVMITDSIVAWSTASPLYKMQSRRNLACISIESAASSTNNLEIGKICRILYKHDLIS